MTNAYRMIWIVFATVLAFELPAGSAIAQNTSSELSRYLTEDTLAIGYVDLDKQHFDLIRLIEMFKTQGKMPAERVSRLTALANEVELQIAKLRETGIKRAVIVLRSIDLLKPSFVVSVEPGKDMAKAADLIQSFLDNNFGISQRSQEMKIQGSTIYLSGPGEPMNQLINPVANSQRDFTEGLAAIDNAAAALLITGNEDSRKALSELIPALPKPFETISGKAVAKDVQWISMKFALAEDFAIDATVSSTDENTATLLQESISSGIGQWLKLKSVAAVLTDENTAKLVEQRLQPQREGGKLKLSYRASADPELSTILAGPTEAALTATALDMELSNLRFLVLAMLNYELSYRKFPNPFAKAKDGSPGLSWRVHLLPIVEENELYNQFKLDEPWNSEHNLKLVEKMPRVFKSPVALNVAPNKTIYQVPVSKTAVFQRSDKQTVRFQDVTDGTSNTLFIVSVAAEEAVIWTKPDDWKVNEADPWIGLDRKGRDEISVARMDGSVFTIKTDMETANLKALITRAGGEVVEP